MPRLPPHVKLPQLDLVDQREVYSNQVREYNNEALKLFNSVGTLQCPACISKQNKQKSEAVDNAITDKGEAVVDASAPPSGPRVFKRASALLSHMDKCCPELVPGSNNADVREAMEKMQVMCVAIIICRAYSYCVHIYCCFLVDIISLSLYLNVRMELI